VAVILQLPEGVGGKPIVVVAVEKNGGVIGNARSAEKILKRGFVDEVAANVVLELGLPVPANSAGDVALVVGGRVNIDFDETEIGRVQVLSDPIRGNENFGVFIARHYLSPLPASTFESRFDAKNKKPTCQFVPGGG